MGWGEEGGQGDLSGEVGIHIERGTQVEEQILGGSGEYVLGLCLKGFLWESLRWSSQVWPLRGPSSSVEDRSVQGLPSCANSTPFLGS